MVEHKLGLFDGALVMWKCGPTDRGKLMDAMSAIGLSKFVPPARSVQASLRLAMSELAETMTNKRGNRAKKSEAGEKIKQAYIVQPHIDPKVDGFELVDVARKAGPNSYENVFSGLVKLVNGKEMVHTTMGTWEIRDTLQERYEALRLEVDGSAVGASLVELLNHFSGTCVRAHGGVYFLPDSGVSDWDKAVNAYEAAGCGANIIDRVRVVLDEQGIRSVKRAITKELVEMSGQIAEELRSGNLTEAAVEKRVYAASALRAKCQLYEGILSTELTECRAILTLAETSMSAGVAVQEDASVFEGVMG